MTDWDFELPRPEPREPYASVAADLEADGQVELARVVRAWTYFSTHRREELVEWTKRFIGEVPREEGPIWSAIDSLERDGAFAAFELGCVVETWAARPEWARRAIAHGALDTLRQEAVEAESRRQRPPHPARKKA
ncbi:MAG: hypothetical protein AAFR54_07860 [Planctomycetota bacterium]